MRRVIVFVAAVLILAAGPVRAAEKPVTIAYAQWSSSIASANLMKALIQEKLGIPCTLVAAGAGEMWRMVAAGEADAMLSAWLPHTHSAYRARYAGMLDDLGPNLEGTRTGLVVPRVTAGRFTAGTGLRNRPYVTTASIPALRKDAQRYRHRIIGIEPDAGVMEKAERALDVYGLRDSFRLESGSEVAMMAELSHAVRHQEWVVFTGWLPHWAFARWNLEFLEDPEGVFSESGSIHTMTRKGLAEENQAVFRLLDAFYWSPEDMGQLMLWIQDDEGLFPYEKALRWIRTHPEKVTRWLAEQP
jgi:glycine betaine/proline transport system substrate-binding protein